MQPRFFLGIDPPKYPNEKTGADNATRLISTLRRENLSLAGCSPAEPVSVSVQQIQNSSIITIFTTCQKSQPFTEEPNLFGKIILIIFCVGIFGGTGYFMYYRTIKPQIINQELEIIEDSVKFAIQDGKRDKALELTNRLVHPIHEKLTIKNDTASYEVFYDEYWDSKRKEYKDQIFSMTNIKTVLIDSAKIQNSIDSTKFAYSDVDTAIPIDLIIKTNTYALIIGNEDYSSFQTGLSKEVNVDFAANDAKTFKEYCNKTLGIPEKQIKLLINATSGQMNQGIAWINNLAKVDNGKAELIFYYSGHGLPDEQTKESYLMPVDVSGSNVTLAIKLADVYSKLIEYPTNKVLVILDACFSGGARNQSLVARKGVKVKPKEDNLTGNMVVISSSTGDESSGVFRDKKHGYMTYFLLKKLQESKGNLSYKELSKYIIENVEKETALSGQTQSPQLIISPIADSTISNWSIK